MSIKSPILPTWEKGLSKIPQRLNSTPSSEQNSTISGLDGFWSRLQEKRVSNVPSRFTSKSKRLNFNANSEKAWRKCASWCSRRQTSLFSGNVNEILDYLTDCYKQWFQCSTRRETSLFSSNVNEILDYLTDCYKQWFQCSTVDNHISAFSAIDESLQEKPIDKDFSACTLLASNCWRPQKLKYCFMQNFKILINVNRNEDGIVKKSRALG